MLAPDNEVGITERRLYEVEASVRQTSGRGGAAILYRVEIECYSFHCPSSFIKDL